MRANAKRLCRMTSCWPVKFCGAGLYERDRLVCRRRGGRYDEGRSFASSVATVVFVGTFVGTSNSRFVSVAFSASWRTACERVNGRRVVDSLLVLRYDGGAAPGNGLRGRPWTSWWMENPCRVEKSQYRGTTHSTAAYKVPPVHVRRNDEQSISLTAHERSSAMGGWMSPPLPGVVGEKRWKVVVFVVLQQSVLLRFRPAIRERGVQQEFCDGMRSVAHSPNPGLSPLVF